MSVDRRYGAVNDPGQVLILIGVLSVTVLGGCGYGALWAAAKVAPDTNDVPLANPFDALGDAVAGEQSWTTLTTVLMVTFTFVTTTVGLLAFLSLRKVAGGPGREPIDAAAADMTSARELRHHSLKEATRRATRLGVDDSPGFPLGVEVSRRVPIHLGFEDVAVAILGPRAGKTTGWAVPDILAAPGAVLATSNKRDLLDATRGPREQVGRVWVFDPQKLAGHDPDWGWDPLTYVTDDVQAQKLAATLASASRAPNARTDAYFDSAGRDLLANLLLAAAVGGRQVDAVWAWLNDTGNDEPVVTLRESRWALQAQSIRGVMTTSDKERSSIYSTARQMAASFTNSRLRPWITRDSYGAALPQFDPAAFVRSNDTIHLLSKEGEGSAGPLVAALTVAILEAAEQLAAASPGGRLRVPMLAMLDEVANVCRWHELPNQYSHFGSRGIVVFALLQSWSQGVEVWGRDGMRKLWSAANVRLIGKGVVENEILTEVSRLVDRKAVTVASRSRSRQGWSTSTGQQREDILTVGELGALPTGRAVALISGSRPMLLRTTPWTEGKQAAAVKESIERYGPAQ